MSFFIQDIYELKNKNSGKGFFNQKNKKKALKFQYAVVEDNEDPDNKGRVKVRFPQWNGIDLDWIPVIRPYSGGGQGLYFMPEVNDLVICLFINSNVNIALVLCAIKRAQDNNPFGNKKLKNVNGIITRSGSGIIFDNNKNEEKIIIRTKDGKIRVTIDKNNGIEIKNELGDIKIKCKKLKIKSGSLELLSERNIKIKSEKTGIDINAKKVFNIQSGKECIMTSKGNISFNGTLTSENKAVAKYNDQAAGIDMHLVDVRAGGATVPTLLPHPYIGKLTNKLSSDVFNNNLQIAYKGSKSEHLPPGHIQTPPGEKFTKGRPSGIGEITSGTINSVLVNGREIAVSGSRVKTCSDPEDFESSFVLAQGLPLILPLMMKCLDDMIYNSDKGFMINSRDLISGKKNIDDETKPKIKKVWWNKDRAQTGETVVLNAELENQYESAQVIFKIWHENADYDKDLPALVLKSRCINNKAEIKFRYFINEPVLNNKENLTADIIREQFGIDVLSDSFKYIIEDYENDFENPMKKVIRLFFTVESFRCEKIKSGIIEIGDEYDVEFYKPNGEKIQKIKYGIKEADGEKFDDLTSSGGMISKKARIPGFFQIKFKKE